MGLFTEAAVQVRVEAVGRSGPLPTTVVCAVQPLPSAKAQRAVRRPLFHPLKPTQSVAHTSQPLGGCTHLPIHPPTHLHVASVCLVMGVRGVCIAGTAGGVWAVVQVRARLVGAARFAGGPAPARQALAAAGGGVETLLGGALCGAGTRGGWMGG